MKNHHATRVVNAKSAIVRPALAILGLAALVSVTTPATAGEWKLSGRVTYANGSGASFAVVQFDLASGNAVVVKADVDGYYEFEAREAGDSTFGILKAKFGGCTSNPVELMDRDMTQNLTLPGNPGDC